jgi:mono/diheme cytochrome c family protein
MFQIKSLNHTVVIVISALLAVSLFLYFSFQQPDERIPYKDAEAVAKGKAIYFAECASCHGSSLEGQVNWKQRDLEGYLPAPPHDESGHTWHHDDQLLFKLTKFGVQAIAGKEYKSNMPAFKKKLTDEQIWHVLAYIKSEWPKDLAQRHTEMVNNK